MRTVGVARYRHALMVSALFILLGQPAKNPAAEAEKLVALANRVTENEGLKAQWVMKKSGAWVKMKTSESHLDKEGAWDSKVDEVVSVVAAKGKFILVSVTAGSPSGDVFDVTNSFYWPDGKLACVEARYQRIDYGGKRFVRWFSKTGSVVKKLTEISGSDGQPSKSAEAIQRAKEFDLSKTPAVLTFKKQPFAKLIKL